MFNLGGLFGGNGGGLNFSKGSLMDSFSKGKFSEGSLMDSFQNGPFSKDSLAAMLQQQQASSGRFSPQTLLPGAEGVYARPPQPGDTPLPLGAPQQQQGPAQMLGGLFGNPQLFGKFFPNQVIGRSR